MLLYIDFRLDYVTLSSSEGYLISASEYGFTAADEPEFETSLSFLSIGCYKNINFIEGPGGPKNCFPGLTITCKKSSFHCTELVSDKAMCYHPNIGQDLSNDVKKLSKLFKG